MSCAAETDCAHGQSCKGGWCTGSASCEGRPTAPDGNAATTDASTQRLCEMGCTTGSCVDGVCVLDCSAPDSCRSDIYCRPNLPCKVVCGDRACEKKVICDDATSCEVVCSGTDACADEILCSADRPCTVSCSGAGSCDKRIKCKESCACDVSCTGLGSCGETPECPQATGCQLGLGCSSQLAGCDRCE